MEKPNSLKKQVILYNSLKVNAYFCTALSLLCLLAIIIYVLVDGIPSLSFQLLFGNYKNGEPSILPALVGTLQLVGIAILIAAPIGVFSAIFLSEYTKNNSKFVKAIRLSVETLAAIPSIVYGLFGYLVFVVSLGWGYSLLGGGITLAIMILPLIVRSTEESLRSVPSGLREGSYALGTSKVRTIFKVVLPSASSGIVTSLILAMGRVLSESAVLILTIGMVVNKMPSSFLSAGTSLALDIYYFANYGYMKEASATACVLLLLILALNLLAVLMGKLLTKGKGQYGRL
jgi:phosphate transport system permease protein